MTDHTKGRSILGLILLLVVIAASVATVVYTLSLHRQHLDREKWKDYDECGL